MVVEIFGLASSVFSDENELLVARPKVGQQFGSLVARCIDTCLKVPGTVTQNEI